MTIDYAPLGYSMDDVRRHLNRLAIAYAEQMEFISSYGYGAWAVDEKRPFGNRSVAPDILEICGIEPEGTEDGEEYYSQRQEEYADHLYQKRLGPFMKELIKKAMTTEPITITTHAQLSALVAEKVMGWTEVQLYSVGWGGLPPNAKDDEPVFIPDYTRDMNAAVEVAMKARLTVDFRRDGAVAMLGDVMAIRESPAIAICIAALRCEGVEVILRLEGEG